MGDRGRCAQGWSGVSHSCHRCPEARLSCTGSRPWGAVVGESQVPAQLGLWSSQPWLRDSRAVDLRAAVWELPRGLASVQGVGTQVVDPSGRHGLCPASRPSGTRGAERWVQPLWLGSPTAGPRTRQGSPLGEGSCLQTP